MLLESLLGCTWWLECIIPLKIKVSAMSMTMIVTTCDVYTGKASVHLLESPTGSFITNESADYICRASSKGKGCGLLSPHSRFFTQAVFCTLILKKKGTYYLSW